MNTKKYITLDQALEVLDRQACYWAADYMELIPAADVAPVVRGKWQKIGQLGVIVVCSVCGKSPDRKTNFCPNCGADMR